MTWRPSILIGLFVATSLNAQQPKNVKILVGMSRPEVQRVMNQMRAGLGVHCHYCHVAGQDPSVDGTPQKARAREMMRMVIDLNQTPRMQRLTIYEWYAELPVCRGGKVIAATNDQGSGRQVGRGAGARGALTRWRRSTSEQLSGSLVKVERRRHTYGRNPDSAVDSG